MDTERNKMKNAGPRGRTLALAAAAFVAVAAMVAVTVARLGPEGSLGYTGSSANPRVGSTVAVLAAARRQPAEPLAFHGPNGQPMTLAAFRGRTVLVNLWATWCPPCVAEMPSLDALQAKLGGRRFQVVTVSLDHGGGAVARRWLDQAGLDHLSAYTADPADFPDAMLPHSMLIDAAGRLVWDGLGGRAWDSPAAAAVIEQVMAEPQ